MGGSDLRNDDGILGKFVVHRVEELDGLVAFGAVVMETEIIGLGLDFPHELLDPRLARCIVGARWADKFHPFLLQGYHFFFPNSNSLLRRHALSVRALSFRLVEEVDDFFVGVLDKRPVFTGKLAFGAHHGSEWSTTIQFWRNPCVPVGDGGEKMVASECDSVH